MYQRDGMSDMSRTSKTTKQVNTIQDMDSIAIEISSLSPREIKDIFKQYIIMDTRL